MIREAVAVLLLLLPLLLLLLLLLLRLSYTQYLLTWSCNGA
jgi:hypothetical protein